MCNNKSKNQIFLKGLIKNRESQGHGKQGVKRLELGNIK